MHRITEIRKGLHIHTRSDSSYDKSAIFRSLPQEFTTMKESNHLKLSDCICLQNVKVAIDRRRWNCDAVSHPKQSIQTEQPFRCDVYYRMNSLARKDTSTSRPDSITPE